MSGGEFVHWCWTVISGVILICLIHDYAQRGGRLFELERRLGIEEDDKDDKDDRKPEGS